MLAPDRLGLQPRHHRQIFLAILARYVECQLDHQHVTVPAARQTRARAEQNNKRFATEAWRPVVLIDSHQEPARVFELYRAADFCIVNSLHDGMNLVAKEFVAARDDEDGVLILSSFAGASRELMEALLVNPFDVSNTADAIQTAVDMPRSERRERMQLMRRTVKENNVYRWAGKMLMDAARVRQRQALARRNTLAPQRFAADGRYADRLK